MHARWLSIALMMTLGCGASSSRPDGSSPAPDAVVNPSTDAGTQDAMEPLADANAQDLGLNPDAPRPDAPAADAEAAPDLGLEDAATPDAYDAGRIDAGSNPPGVRRIVAVGYGGRRLYSDDLGLTWSGMVEDVPMGSDDTYLLRAVAFGQGLFVTQGFRTYTSTRGEAWDRRTHGDNWRGAISYGNGVFLSVGGVGRASLSTDGRTWRDLGVVARNHLRAMAFGAGLFVAIGDGARRISTADGLRWAGETTGGNNLNSIAFGAGGFVAVGQGGRITRTVDGVRWDEQSSPTTADLGSVVFDGQGFVAVGASVILRSSDGQTWTSQMARNLPGNLFHVDGVWLGTRWADGIYRSTDLVTWTPVYRYTANHLRAFAVGDLP